MSILSVVRDVCLAIGVNPPASMFSPNVQPRTQSELLSLANEMAQRIAYDNREWTKLKKTNVFTGDGVVTNDVLTGTVGFDLPANFKRMLLSANVWRSNQVYSPMRFIPDADEWIQRRMNVYSDPRGEWTMMGGMMHIMPILRAEIAATATTPVIPAETATFVYLDKNCVVLDGGGFGDTFTTDADRFVLDERLLKLGMIWQWKANKGSPYAEDMGSYSDALVLAMGTDSPSPIIVGQGVMTSGIPSYRESEAGWR